MYTKKVLMVDNTFSSITPLELFNPNFQKPYNDYFVIINDEKNRLCYRNQYSYHLGQVEEYIYYKENGNVDKIISLKYDENDNLLTYHSSFEYFDNNVLKKTVLIKKDTFFSLNKLGYSYDGLNVIYDIPEKHNELIDTEILSFQQLLNYLQANIPFYDELNYNDFEYNETEEIIESNDDFILTRIRELSENGHFIIYDKKYGNREYNKGLLLEKKLHVAVNDNSEKDDDLDYYRGISGTEIYGYDNKQLTYLENPFYSLSININPAVGNVKLEQGILVDRESLKVIRLYSIYEENTNTFDQNF